LATNTRPNSVVSADFNHDGKMDIAVASYYNDPGPPGIQVFLGKGNGTFGPPITYDTNNGAGPIAVADLAGHGNSDLVGVNQALGFVSVLIGNGDGTFRPPVNYVTLPNPTQVAVGDFNGDGKLDIAVAGQGDYASIAPAVDILLGNGDGTFQEPAITTSLPSGPNAMTSGHFGAGSLDLAIVLGFASSDRVQILVGNGDGTFTLGESYELTALNSESIVAADFRNDGRSDLAIAELEGRGVAVLLGTGDDEFEQPVTYDIAYGASAVAAADMNGDGILDLVATGIPGGLESGDIGIFYGIGNGMFRDPVLYAERGFPGAIAIADFNSDGQPDITVADEDSDQEKVLLNTGIVSFSPTSPLIFKQQAVGTTSAPQGVTLTNGGMSELKIRSMKASAEFAVTSSCGATVAPGARCTIAATFSPTKQGATLGTISIIDSASSKPQVIELLGSGT
jgi:Abnormal spindle-like microcephaly-assoc'd, ASPM-SPD-2-Hydin/FG-GAP-like repeat/FG-GAP repeat